VADSSGAPGDRSSSLGGKQTSGNPAVSFGGAVPTVAIARANHATKPSQIRLSPSARSMQLLRCQRFQGTPRWVFATGVEPSSRLCVLMNPIPAGLEIRPDLAGWRVFPFWKNGLVLENPISCCPDFPDCEQEAKLAIISHAPGGGTKADSVHETAHADVHYRAQRQERKQDRRSAVTH
jgi:hypothetical protein